MTENTLDQTPDDTKNTDSLSAVAEPGTETATEATNGRPTFTLQQFPEKMAVVRLPAGSEIPAWAESASLLSITATATETSLVCAGRNVPTKTQAQRGLTAFAVQGPLDFALVGVLAALLVPLAEEQISVFTISTYDTDWILVPIKDKERAAEAWRREGHTVADAIPVTPPRKTKKK